MKWSLRQENHKSQSTHQERIQGKVHSKVAWAKKTKRNWAGVGKKAINAQQRAWCVRVFGRGLGAVGCKVYYNKAVLVIILLCNFSALGKSSGES